MELNCPKDIISFTDCLYRHEAGEFPYPPMTYLRRGINGTVLLIGYTKCGNAVVIRNNSITSVETVNITEAIEISELCFNKYYKKAPRTSSIISIFRKPVVGDIVMCVSKERYTGCSLGVTYTVKEIKNGRLAFEVDAQYTYDEQYFIVVGSKEFVKNPCGEVISDRLMAPLIAMSIIPVYSTEYIRNIILDEDEIKQRVIKDSTKLIRRPRLEDDILVQRKYIIPERVQRSK